MSASPFCPTQVGRHHPFEVFSALQKSIRRGDEEAALYWATELYLSDLASHAWSRLRIIAAEDVGLAAPDVIVQVNTLRTIWKDRKAAPDARLYFVMAVLLLVRAPKSRIVDHALICHFDSANGRSRKVTRDHREMPEESRGAVDDGKKEPPIPEPDDAATLLRVEGKVGYEARKFDWNDRPRREIPSFALDKHTTRGKAMGHGIEHFFDIGAVLVNQTLPDPYLERAKAACLHGEAAMKLEASIEKNAAEDCERAAEFLPGESPIAPEK